MPVYRYVKCSTCGTIKLANQVCRVHPQAYHRACHSDGSEGTSPEQVEIEFTNKSLPCQILVLRAAVEDLQRRLAELEGKS